MISTAALLLALLAAEPAATDGGVLTTSPAIAAPNVEAHAELRARGEEMWNLDLDPAVKATGSPQWDGDRVLMRTRASGLFSWEHLAGLVQLQDSRSFGDEPTTISNLGNLDLHQGYLELRRPGELPLLARVGRTELNYGDQRLVGALGWDNVGRSFDAVLLRGTPGPLTVDGFWARLHQDPRGSFNRALGDDFFGLYGSYKHALVTVDAYTFMLYDRGGAQDTNGDGVKDSFRLPGGGELYLWTPGLRVDSKPWRALHLNGELALQFGTRGKQTVSAYALHAQADYTFAIPLSPKFALGYDRASGDADANDNRWGTFENLFPTNHDKYGLIDLAAWKNLSDPWATVAVKPHSNLTLAATGHLLSRVSTEDTFYRASGAPLRDRAVVLSRDVNALDVGTELDLTAAWEPVKGLSTLLGYSRLWAGKFLAETAPAGGTTADPAYLYLQVTGAF